MNLHSFLPFTNLKYKFRILINTRNDNVGRTERTRQPRVEYHKAHASSLTSLSTRQQAVCFDLKTGEPLPTPSPPHQVRLDAHINGPPSTSPLKRCPAASTQSCQPKHHQQVHVSPHGSSPCGPDSPPRYSVIRCQFPTPDAKNEEMCNIRIKPAYNTSALNADSIHGRVAIKE